MRRWIPFSSLLIAVFSHASFALFCPTNFNTIYVGDTLKQVETQCGKPNSIRTYKTSVDQPQEWNYYAKLNPTDQGTLKVSFAFVNERVINMSVNGIGVGASTICNGINLQLGSSATDVKKACGNPTFINQTNSTPDANAPTSTTAEWTYSDNRSTPIILLFQNGLLKGQK